MLSFLISLLPVVCNLGLVFLVIAGLFYWIYSRLKRVPVHRDLVAAEEVPRDAWLTLLPARRELEGLGYRLLGYYQTNNGLYEEKHRTSGCALWHQASGTVAVVSIMPVALGERSCLLELHTYGEGKTAISYPWKGTLSVQTDQLSYREQRFAGILDLHQQHLAWAQGLVLEQRWPEGPTLGQWHAVAEAQAKEAFAAEHADGKLKGAASSFGVFTPKALRLLIATRPERDRTLRRYAKTSYDQALIDASPTPPVMPGPDGKAEDPFVAKEIDSFLRQMVDERERGVWAAKIPVLLIVAGGAVFIILQSPSLWSYVLPGLMAVGLHEVGHLVGMLLVRQTDASVILFPGQGSYARSMAADALPGTKRLIILFAGILPGLALGAYLKWAGLAEANSYWAMFAQVLLVINGLNLIPMLGDDGSQIVKYAWLSHWPWCRFALLCVGIVFCTYLWQQGIDFLGLGILFALAHLSREWLQYRRLVKIRHQLLPQRPHELSPEALLTVAIRALDQQTGYRYTSFAKRFLTLNGLYTDLREPPASRSVVFWSGLAYGVALLLFCYGMLA